MNLLQTFSIHENCISKPSKKLLLACNADSPISKEQSNLSQESTVSIEPLGSILALQIQLLQFDFMYYSKYDSQSRSS
jgi:hypothetical protein